MTSTESRCECCGDPLGSGPACRRCGEAPSDRLKSIGFMGGLGALFRGGGFLLGRPRLWSLAALPVLLTALLFAGLTWAAVAWAGSVADGLAAGDWGFFSFLQGAVKFLIPVIAFLLVAAVAFFTFTVVGTAVASPFLDLLTARVEAERLPKSPAADGSFLRDLARSVTDAVRLVVLQVGVLLISFPLNFIPVVGTLLWILIGAWLSAFDYLDFPLVRHRYRWRQRWAFLRRHAGASLGFGVGAFALLLIPFLNLLILPVAAVGATLLYLDLRPK